MTGLMPRHFSEAHGFGVTRHSSTFFVFGISCKPVILSEAKDLHPGAASDPEILRFAQDDGSGVGRSPTGKSAAL
jgi:hypothetical protein